MTKAVEAVGLSDLDLGPDGKQLVCVTTGGLLFIDADGNNRRKISEGDDACPKFTADGTHIAFLRKHHLLLMTADGRGARPLAAESR